MTLETDQQLQEFRAIQGEHFDKDGKYYTGTLVSFEIAERMLKLINQLEKEINYLDRNKKVIWEPE